MNILFISHENKLNGANKSMLNLIDALSKEHRFYVWCRGEDGPLIDELKSRNICYTTEYYYAWCTYFIKQPRNILHLLWRKSKWYLKEQFYNKRVVKAIIPFLKEHEIDLIHLNSSIINIGIELKKQSDIPVLWHFREFGKEDFGWEMLTTKRYFYKYIRNNADKVVAVSKAVANKYRNYLKTKQLTVVYNGVDKKNINPKPTYNKDSKKKLIVLQTGVLCKQKGQQIAIEAMRILREDGIDNIELLLAGSGNLPVNFSSSYLKSIGVILLGQVENMVKLREKVDIELVCSRAEAFGRVTIEAMMSGIPVIGSKSGGTPELIENQKTGLLFSSGNALELANQIRYVYFNRNEIERMGKNAFQYAKDYFLIDRCAAEINKLYYEIVNNKE